MRKINALDMEIAVTYLIDYRKHSIVPNVFHGLNLFHECDLLVLDKDGRFTEVEIKISKSDLMADFRKTHGHRSKIISRLIYAVTDEILETALRLVPKENGIISVSTSTDPRDKTPFYTARWVRMCRHNKNRPTRSDIDKFYELGNMRIWSLKRHLRDKSKQQFNPKQK